MHNRKKPTQPLSAAESTAAQEKCRNYQSLVDVLFERRKNKDVSKETLGILFKMLKSNPDFYSLWNYRREILIAHCPGLENPAVVKLSGSDELMVRDEELALSEEGIRRNPKSYCAWQHRVWVMGRFAMDFDRELALCRALLKEDQRNFHCWNYRRLVVLAAGRDPAAELAFSLEKIQENFSNYSAFHQRSVFLRLAGRAARDCLAEELRLVESAVYTEPDDQSAWWYHQFLLGWAAEELRGGGAEEDAEEDAEWFAEVLRAELRMAEGLAEVEPGCRWALTCAAAVALHLANTLLCMADGNYSAERAELLRGRTSVLTALATTVDPAHAARYRSLMRTGGTR